MTGWDIFKRRNGAAYRVLCGVLAFTFSFSWAVPLGYAQVVSSHGWTLQLPTPGTMVTPTAGFTPILVKGITIHPENPLQFDFIVDPGDSRLGDDELRTESTRLIKYFLASLTVPEDELWVNLSPYEKDRIISNTLSQTEMGRDMLAQDYILKQLTASLMYPEKELGKKFWDKIYRKAREQYGTTEIPVNTFNKVWIVPEKAVVYEHDNSAFVVESRLKVMLESDYLAMTQGTGDRVEGTETKLNPEPRTLNPATEIIREIILPEIEKEVNEGETFAKLRQVYNSMILAAWYKQNLKETLLGQVYVNRARIKGVDLDDKEISRKIYNQYLEAFRKGVYNYIKEDYDPATHDVIPRKYFSGGVNASQLFKLKEGIQVETNQAELSAAQRGRLPKQNAVQETVALVEHTPGNREYVQKVEEGKDTVSSPVILPEGRWEDWVQTVVTMSDLNVDMFRDYDYRNIGPFLKPAVVFRLGLVWADMAIKKAEAGGILNRTVLVAKDARKIEPKLEDALVAALRYRGLNVIYVAKDTPNAVTSYSWAVQQFKPLMSIFITASHVSKPEEEIVRGFKVAMLNEAGGNIQSLSTREIKVESLERMKEIIQNPDKLRRMEASQKGTFTAENIDGNVIRFNTLVGKMATANASFYELGEAIRKAEEPLTVLARFEERYRDVELPLKGMKIVVDGSHTPSGKLTAATFRNLGADVTTLNEDVQEVSGMHKADPSIRANLKELEDKIIETGADFGMAFDLDGDRGVIHVPVRLLTIPEPRFESLAPDNLITILLPSLKNDWGYNLSGKRYGVIRDVLGTHGVNDRAGELGMEFYQTDAGYVFLKAKKEAKEKEGVIFPIYGERSGHIWMNVTGEIENPLAVGVVFAVLARREKKAFFDKRAQGISLKGETIRPILDVIREREVPYSQSPRFQPFFHPDLLARLSEDERNTTGWHYDRNANVWRDGSGKSQKNPPQGIIALGRDVGIKMLKEKFVPGKTYATPAGMLTVREFNDYLDPEEGLYRFADIVFERNGQFAGRFVFRASSNDPSFVASYETPIKTPIVRDEEVERTLEKRESTAGVVIDFLSSGKLSVVTKDDMARLLFPHSTPDDLQKQYDKANLSLVEQEYRNYKKGVIPAGETEEAGNPQVNVSPDETQDLGGGETTPETSSPIDGKMAMTDLPDSAFAGKTVFIRPDFNVSFKKGKIADDTRIREALPTIQYAVERGAKVVLAAHLGDPQKEIKKLTEDFIRAGEPEQSAREKAEQAIFLKRSLDSVAVRLKELGVPVHFFSMYLDTAHAAAFIENMRPGGVLLLENIRFNPGETTGDEDFARRLFQGVEVFIFDGAGAVHHNHVSVSGAPKNIARVAGFLMEKEIHVFSDLIKRDPPEVMVNGGSKVSSKIGVIRAFLNNQKVKHILIGGAMANAFFVAKGFSIGATVVGTEAADVEIARTLLDNSKVVIPSDVVAVDNFDVPSQSKVINFDNGEAVPEGWVIVDIGPETIARYKKIIAAGSAFWNGPMGAFDKGAVAPFAGEGTKEVGQAVAAVQGIVGGGDSLEALKVFGLTGYKHVSTMGGAALEFLEGKALPGIAALSDKTISSVSGKEALPPVDDEDIVLEAPSPEITDFLKPGVGVADALVRYWQAGGRGPVFLQEIVYGPGGRRDKEFVLSAIGGINGNSKSEFLIVPTGLNKKLDEQTQAVLLVSRPSVGESRPPQQGLRSEASSPIGVSEDADGIDSMVENSGMPGSPSKSVGRERDYLPKSTEIQDPYAEIISDPYLPGPQGAKKEVGGINLDPALLDLQIKRDGNGVPLPLPQQPISEMHIEGFIPVIINITPVTNLPMLLGLAETGIDQDEARPDLKAREVEEVSALN